MTDLPFTAFTGLESKTLSAETESIGSSMQTLVPVERRPSFHGSRRRSLWVFVLLALLRFALCVMVWRCVVCWVCGVWCVVCRVDVVRTVHMCALDAGSVLYVCL